ncbi:MAG: flagellar export protein FliJ [Verrucomicrobia bacterium]|nr:flagellar export protein FliJ [Verrucomicrobiota bacterium]
MKRFVFRFQRVLEMRRHGEDVKKNELAALMAQRLQDERKLFAVQGELLDRQCELAGRAEAHETLSDLAGLARYFLKLADDIRCVEEQLVRWDAQIEAKRIELVEAKRDVKVLEKIEESDRRAYDKALAGWEQKLIDEVATGRHVRRLREEVQR